MSNNNNRRNQQQNVTYPIYTVINRDGKDPFWLKIGMAFKNKDGQGFNLEFNALPIDGKAVMRKHDPNEHNQDDRGNQPRRQQSQGNNNNSQRQQSQNRAPSRQPQGDNYDNQEDDFPF